ncbi:enoyl-CoA hydratase-related protein [Rhodococcus sp. (in: high G+C Gram-positive bacteria)]|uniref:enoyl-CoA hydratase-related protein n=1 Tax=Rhodococcus sp. TaxID=1831 RepID=UPI001A225EEF|nr:enoyl-CoA hydratase-related protein [Rhodococcus sp. (in: high G+C Gram-positive bacteria)]MBJ7481671.1 enoyl-CoA hydratase/isomerase family protein [Rhodococcus sp. (in: high G+C Gram-positive bacteria)]
MSAPGQDSELVHLATEGGVSVVTLDSPKNRNALSAQLRADLLGHLRSAIDDEATRTVVLTHTGPVFCAGADLKEARTGDTSRSGQELVDLMTMLLTSPKPVIARLRGPARAGGIGLVASCDFAVAADTVTLGFSETRIGVIPAVISVPLRLRVAAADLHRLFLTGETFDAHHAARIGLISEVATAENLDAAIARLTEKIGLGAPRALAGVKEMLHPPATTLAEQFDRMLSLTSSYFASPEAQEGMLAFSEKRPPYWAVSGADSTT